MKLVTMFTVSDSQSFFYLLIASACMAFAYATRKLMKSGLDVDLGVATGPFIAIIFLAAIGSLIVTVLLGVFAGLNYLQLTL